MTRTIFFNCRIAESLNCRKERGKDTRGKDTFRLLTLVPTSLPAILPSCNPAMSKARLRQFEGTQQRSCFVARLLELRRRARVHDDAGAGLHVGGALRHDHRADGDAEVEVAREVDVADGAR